MRTEGYGFLFENTKDVLLEPLCRCGAMLGQVLIRRVIMLRARYRQSDDIEGVIVRPAMGRSIGFFAIALVALFAGHIGTAFAQSPGSRDFTGLRPHDGPRIRHDEGPLTVERRVRGDMGLRNSRNELKRAEQGVADVAFTGTDAQRQEAAKRLERAVQDLDWAIVLVAREMSDANRKAFYQWERKYLNALNAKKLSPAERAAQIQALRQWIESALAPEIEMIREAVRAADAAARDAGAAPTPIGLRPTFGNTMLNGSGVLAAVSLPQQSYLGSFDPVSGHERIGLFQTNRRVTMTGGTFSFEQNFGSPAPVASSAPTGPFFAYGAFQAAQGSASGSGTFDPGVGNRMLLPGPKGGASGISLGGYPANIVSGITYRNEYESAGGMVGLGYRFPVSPSVRVSAGGHIGFQKGEIEQHFSGEIPGFARDFAYDTFIATNVVTFGAKGQIDWMALPSLRTFVKGHAGVGLVKGDGSDTLAFTGLPTSVATLAANRTQVVGGVSAGFELVLAAGPTHSVSVGAEVGFERVPGFASVSRDGTNSSQLHLTGADAISGKAKIGVLF